MCSRRTFSPGGGSAFRRTFSGKDWGHILTFNNCRGAEVAAGLDVTLTLTTSEQDEPSEYDSNFRPALQAQAQASGGGVPFVRILDCDLLLIERPTAISPSAAALRLPDYLLCETSMIVVVPLTSLATTTSGLPFGLSSALMKRIPSGPRSPARAKFVAFAATSRSR